MSFSSKVSFVFRKYPLLRAGLVLFLLLLSVLVSIFLTRTEIKKPEFETIIPSTAMPGDRVLISGKNFGKTRGSGYVEFNGNRLTSSAYISWTDSLIEILLPQNIQDGLVYVVTDGGKSSPKIFANKIDIPVQIRSNPQNLLPVFERVKELSGEIGKIITIQGKNFGSARNDSQVFFFTEINDEKAENYISCFDVPQAYDFWSDSEIRVRVPDGACSGKMYVKTEKGNSNYYNFKIDSSAGLKKYSDKRIYLLAMNTDISDCVVTGDATITLRIPKPTLSATQRSVEVTLSKPEPVIPDYLGTIVHQFLVKKNSPEQLTVTHNFVVQTYAVNTTPQAAKIPNYSNDTKQRYSAYLQNDFIVPSSDDEIIKLAKKIAGAEKNPYSVAKKIYQYMLDTYKLEQKPINPEIQPIELIHTSEGDAYSYAIIYTALCRAAGIPAIPCAGILIDSNKECKNHWWNEIYFEKIGWISVDTSLGAGLNYEAFRNKNPDPSFYFGNIDAQHVIFSRGWKEIKPAHSASKIVYRPRSYAFQSIWEESTPGIKKYSSFWSNIQVQGIY